MKALHRQRITEVSEPESTLETQHELGKTSKFGAGEQTPESVPK